MIGAKIAVPNLLPWLGGVPPLSSFANRVTADGGTLVSPAHTEEVYNEVSPYGPSLLCTCDAGKATKLYNIIPT